jgi:serine/threonine protein kinase
VLVERLGRGGVAETWRARRETDHFDAEVCIKRPLRALGPEERRAMLEEARLLARIRHVNVVGLIDVIEDDDRPCLVLELVRGADLGQLARELARRGDRLPPPVVAAVGALLCRALAAAQRAVPGGLVHRDVTPHNVLVSTEGEIKLADFGIARAFDRERWTGPGLVKGKCAFVSPEQLGGLELDLRSDLFSVGVVLYELLSGRRPFGGPAGAGALQAIAAGDRRPLAAPHAPPALVDAVERLLAHDRAGRPPSADVAARMLARHADEQRALDVLRGTVLSLTRPGIVSAKPRDERLNGWMVGADPTM